MGPLPWRLVARGFPLALMAGPSDSGALFQVPWETDLQPPPGEAWPGLLSCSFSATFANLFRCRFWSLI